MRELAILTFQTLDGVIQAPKLPTEDPSGGFRLGGWADPYWDSVMDQVQANAMNAPYDLLLGKTTFDIFEKAHSGNGTEKGLSGHRKFVVTSSQSPLTWENSFAVTGDIPDEISRLKAQDGPLLQVHGSWQLLQLLHAENLIDEYRLWTFPVIAGHGKRLFQEGAGPGDLNLARFEPLPNGVFMNFWRRSDNLTE